MRLHNIISSSLAAALVFSTNASASQNPRPGQRAIKKQNRPIGGGNIEYQTPGQNAVQPPGVVRGPPIEVTHGGIQAGHEDSLAYSQMTPEQYHDTAYKLSSNLVFRSIAKTADPDRRMDSAGWAKKNTQELLVLLGLVQMDPGFKYELDPVEPFDFADKCSSKDEHVKQVIHHTGKVFAHVVDIDKKSFTKMDPEVAKFHPSTGQKYADLLASAEKRVMLERKAAIGALQQAFVIVLKAHARTGAKHLTWGRRSVIPAVEKFLAGKQVDLGGTGKDETRLKTLFTLVSSLHEFVESFSGILKAFTKYKQEGDLITPARLKTNEVTQAEMKEIKADGTYKYIKDSVEKMIKRKEGLTPEKNKEVSKLKVARLIAAATITEIETFLEMLINFNKSLEGQLRVDLIKLTEKGKLTDTWAEYKTEMDEWEAVTASFKNKIASCTEENFPTMNFVEAWTKDVGELYNIMQKITVYRAVTTEEMLLMQMIIDQGVKCEGNANGEIEVPGDDELYDTSSSSDAEVDTDDSDESSDSLELQYCAPLEIKALAAKRQGNIDFLISEREKYFKIIREALHQANAKSLELLAKKLRLDEMQLKEAKTKLIQAPAGQTGGVGEEVLGSVEARGRPVWFNPRGFARGDGSVSLPDAAKLKELMHKVRDERRKFLNEDIKIEQPDSLAPSIRRYLGVETEEGASPLSLLERVSVDKAVAAAFKNSIPKAIEAGEQYVKQLLETTGADKFFHNDDDESPNDVLKRNFEDIAKKTSIFLKSQASTLGKELFGVMQTADDSNALAEEIQQAMQWLGTVVTDVGQATWFIDLQMHSPTLASHDVANMVLHQMFAITYVADVLREMNKIAPYISAFEKAARAVHVGDKEMWGQLAHMSQKTEGWKEFMLKATRRAPQVARRIKGVISATQDYLNDAKQVITGPISEHSTQEEKLALWDELYERRYGIIAIKAVIEHFGNRAVTRLDWAKKEREEMLRGLDGLLKTIEAIRLFVKEHYPTVPGKNRPSKHKFNQVEFNDNALLGQFKKQIEAMEGEKDKWHYQFPPSSLEYPGLQVPWIHGHQTGFHG